MWFKFKDNKDTIVSVSDIFNIRKSEYSDIIVVSLTGQHVYLEYSGSKDRNNDYQRLLDLLVPSVAAKSNSHGT